LTSNYIQYDGKSVFCPDFCWLQLYKASLLMASRNILIIIFLLIGNIVFSQSFTVKVDTLNIHFKDFTTAQDKIALTHAIKYRNNYYCFFEAPQEGHYKDLRFFLIISGDGKVVQDIKVPKEIQNSYYFDLFLKNDSVFTKTYMDHDIYFLDINKLRWVNIKEVDDMIYEDDKFYITYLDFGEWGGTTWFKDKRSGKEYELASSGTIINKIDNTYYVTAAHKIIMIENPLKMKPCNKDYYYEEIQKKKAAKGTNSLLGATVIYSDSTYSDWDYKKLNNYVATSFIANDEIFHLCVDSTKTYIAILENGKLVPIKKIGNSYLTFNWYYSYRCRIQNTRQLLKFTTKRPNGYGLMEIDGEKVKIRYLTFNK
jgi:hypothetical protein